jgi:hypothetical protein
MNDSFLFGNEAENPPALKQHSKNKKKTNIPFSFSTPRSFSDFLLNDSQ